MYLEKSPFIASATNIRGGKKKTKKAFQSTQNWKKDSVELNQRKQIKMALNEKTIDARPKNDKNNIRHVHFCCYQVKNRTIEDAINEK